MKQKVLALLLVLALAFSLTACGNPPSSSSGSGSSSGGGTSSPDSGETGSSEEGSGNLQKVIMSFMLYTGRPADTEKVQASMNELLKEDGVEVELNISDAASYKQNMTLALSSGEQQDIINVSYLGYASLVSQGYLTDLEENGLIGEYGKGILENIDPVYVDACRIGGVLYGITQNRDMAQGRGGFVIPVEYLDAINYAIPEHEGDEILCTQEDIDEIFAQIHEAFPDKEIFRPVANGYTAYNTVDTLGGDSFGVLLNDGQEPVVENLFTSDKYYIDYCKMMYAWNQLGYIGQDAVTDTTSLTELVSSGKVVSYMTRGKPGIVSQESGLCHKDVAVFQVDKDYMASSSISGSCWAIPGNTADPVAAMKAMNAFYSVPEMANLLSWGIEGDHYQVTDDGHITFPDGIDSSTSGYYHPLQWMMPNQYITHVWDGNDLELYTQLDEFNTASLKSCALGFTFDTTNVATEMTALQNVYDEYQKSIEFGMVEPESAIAEMNEKMMSAGLQTVIDEKQKQLDEFMALQG